MQQVKSKVSRLQVRVLNKGITRTRRRTGGDGGGNDDESAAERAHAYNIGMMHRMYYGHTNITNNAIMKAMVNRWGRPLKCELVDRDNFKALRVVDEAYKHTDQTEVQKLVACLNAYGVGSQFIDFLKYDSSVRDPRFLEEYILCLNIPIAGPRLAEWNGKEN